MILKFFQRGDWSDTGPEARPERERQRQEEQETRNDEDQENSEGASGSNRSTLGMMERFSQLLTHWLERQIAGDVEGDERASVTISPAGLSEVCTTRRGKGGAGRGGFF